MRSQFSGDLAEGMLAQIEEEEAKSEIDKQTISLVGY
jgi:hypothetical protein